MQLIIQALEQMEARLEPAVQKALEEVAKLAQSKVKETKLFKSASGGLLDNIIIINGHLSSEVIANKNYAYYLEYGNNQKGMFIYPVKAKALHFFVNGTEVFCKKARTHPPLPFMKEALAATIPHINEIFHTELNKVI